MPRMEWSQLSTLQLGRYAEYFAKMEFASYGFEVYTSEVDDHGIDFIAKTRKSEFLEIQVKSLRWPQTNYIFMQKDKWDVDNPNLYLALLIFNGGQMPEAYLIPATVWREPSALFVDYDYVDLKSKPEYGLRLSKKNMPLLEPYVLDVKLVNLKKD